MKKIILLFTLIYLSTQVIFGQVIYSSKIDSILNLVSVQSLSKMNKELSGDTIVNIGGVPQKIFSRYAPSIGNVKAVQYIFEKFQSFGLNAKYMISSATNYNVYAVKTGTKFPGKKYLIGGHYDNIIYPLPGLNDTIHGADDNSSGVCAVLEAARLLSNMSLDYTVIFVAFDEEEGPGNGGEAFADSLLFRGDSLLGVINLDMIAYDNNNDNKADVWANNNSVLLRDVMISCNQVYQIGLTLNEKINGYGSDQIAFWTRGFKAIAFAEDYDNFNPYYHTKNDTYNKFNVQYYIKNVKAAVAALLTWSLGSFLEINHTPLASTTDTSMRIATVDINSPLRIGSGTNAPRLYFKVDNGTYSFVNAFEITQNKYKFSIPGKPKGSKISYYVAVQDSSGTIVSTTPRGGSGINPPGTTPPQNPNVYYIWSQENQFTQCSNTLPKPIYDFQVTTDTIHISQTGIITDLKVSLNINHSNDGDIFILLYSPAGNLTMCYFLGQNGQNYTNTIFDDTASLLISQGTPPFNGRFRPQFGNLYYFYNKQITGNWILIVYDNAAGNTGTLLNWCLSYKCASQILVRENNQLINDYKLFQNYPNPFNPVTAIRFQIKDSKFTTLKIYDLLGREVKTLLSEFLSQGAYSIDYDASEISSGVYFYKLESGNFKDVKKMLLIK